MSTKMYFFSEQHDHLNEGHLIAVWQFIDFIFIKIIRVKGTWKKSKV